MDLIKILSGAGYDEARSTEIATSGLFTYDQYNDCIILSGLNDAMILASKLSNRIVKYGIGRSGMFIFIIK